jgi:hypothetical protein
MSALKRARLSAVALGVALGLVKGGWMLAVTLSAMYGSYGTELVTHWAAMYPGVDASVKGALILGAWGFVAGFFMGLIIAWIYNVCLCCCNRSHCACCKTSCGTCTCSCNTKVVEKI